MPTFGEFNEARAPMSTGSRVWFTTVCWRLLGTTPVKGVANGGVAGHAEGANTAASGAGATRPWSSPTTPVRPVLATPPRPSTTSNTTAATIATHVDSRATHRDSSATYHTAVATRTGQRATYSARGCGRGMSQTTLPRPRTTSTS